MMLLSFRKNNVIILPLTTLPKFCINIYYI